ncbi:MAG: bifunctional 4-hydroxy-2-oxoglutarate aldolase/2-dehydro-3-deoxy-phosphogluconate aldolase [Lentimicrobiaceae bacterium]
MHQFSKSEISSIMASAGIIPVFYHADPDVTIQVVNACYKGGCKVFEYTNRGEKAKSNFPAIKKFIEENCPGMILGIGSILNAEQAMEFVELGADFIVSPILDKKTGKWCAKNDIYWVPGCGTLTECAKALTYGADIIKVFPGNVLGPGFVKAVLGPMPMLRLMPTGGVEPTEKSLNEWFKAGVICVGIGSQLISGEVIKNHDFDKLESDVKNAFKIIAQSGH